MDAVLQMVREEMRQRERRESGERGEKRESVCVCVCVWKWRGVCYINLITVWGKKFMEQNQKKKTTFARRAKQGHKLTWILTWPRVTLRLFIALHPSLHMLSLHTWQSSGSCVDFSDGLM